MIELIALAGIVGLCAGYLLRRWHRPTGFISPGFAPGEWQVLGAGGSPYMSVSIRGRYEVSALALAEMAKAVQSGHAPASPAPGAPRAASPIEALRDACGPGTP